MKVTPKQVMDIKASAGMTTGQSNEHQRCWTERGKEDAARNGNYDLSRMKLNFEITKGGKIQPIDQATSIPERMKATLEARGISDPNMKKMAKGLEPNIRTVVNIIFGGERERMHQLAYGDQKVNLEFGADNSHITRHSDIEGWARDIYAFACDHWGEENIIGFYVHLDETSPHIHCTVLPVADNGKISFKKVFAGKDLFEFRQRTAKLHDELAEVNKQWGLDRGLDKRLTGARHRPTEQYRSELRRDCIELENRKTDSRLELDSLNEEKEQLRAEVRKARKRVKGLTSMIRNLENRQDELKDRIAELTTGINDGIGDSKELAQELERLKGELSMTNASLLDKRDKLIIADEQLTNLEAEEKEISGRNSKLRAKLDELGGNVQELIRMKVTDAVYGTLVTNLKKAIDLFTPEQRDAFGRPFMCHLAEKPGEILQCAMWLFAGYVDGAIQFAETHGGGGEMGTDLRWGRAPDEDDQHFAYRCMVQAHKLMKPVKQQSRGRGR